MTDGTFPLERNALPLLMPSRIERAGPADTDAPPACPLCGASMVRRTARSGPRSGTPIWGCITFPGCRGTLDIGGTSGRFTKPRVMAGTAPGAADPGRWATDEASRAGSVAAAMPMAVAARGVGRSAAVAARRATDVLTRTSAAALEIARPAAQRAAARVVDLTLDVLHPEPAAEPVGGRNVAGASAQAEFERRRARHRMKMRAALPAIVGITLIAMAMAFLVLLPHGLVVAGFGGLAVGSVGVWGISRLPSDALAWGRSAAGERRTASHLDELVADGYVMLHDRLIPGTRANIDHVAIGPAGVFVIETKDLRGKLTIVGEKLFVGERTRTGVIDETYREALAVQVCLADPLNALRSTVRPVLCIHRTMQLLLDNEVQGVRVVSGPQLARFLRRLPALLDAETVQELAAIADQRLLPSIP